jgi:hypothetical protein
MLSLPLALGTTIATIPCAASYLHADAAQAALWRTRLGAMAQSGPRIGLAWAGDPGNSPAQAARDRRRSFTLDRLAPLFEVPGLHFLSLQKNRPVAAREFPLTDVMHEMGDFADTAALIANLDLVISVDTAVAHLGAALGKPVWVLYGFETASSRTGAGSLGSPRARGIRRCASTARHILASGIRSWPKSRATCAVLSRPDQPVSARARNPCATT